MSDDGEGPKTQKQWWPYALAGKMGDALVWPATSAKSMMDSYRQNHTNVYYHKKIKRVPTIDQCEVGNTLCEYEAQQQLVRDFQVDKQIVSILRQRLFTCMGHYDEITDASSSGYCNKEKEDYQSASLAYFIKYGELGGKPKAKECYMKQKHRMIWERRNATKLTENVPKDF